MVASKCDYKHLSVITMKTRYGEMYQLRLSSRLGRKTIGLGSNKLAALNIALLVDEEIERLIITGNEIDLDALKDIVKSEQDKTKAKKLSPIKLVEKDDLVMLWTKYVDFHQALGVWTETYLLSHITTVGRILAKCPYQKLEQKTEIVNWLFESEARTKRTSKERFKLIVAAIDWNSKQGNIPRKWGIEYRDLLESISIKTEKKIKLADEETVEIFSVKEVYLILDALKNETYSRFQGKHEQYYKYVYFCWLTGCRPSEAIALKWENVDLRKNRIKFCEAEVLTSGGKIVKKQGTKTVPYRYFPINQELRELLESIPYRTGYVFRNALGKPISQQALYGVWKYVLNGLGIRFRIPYQLRHTMISYHANNDYPIHKLAELVGNSEQIIKEHYLKLDIERITLPDVIRSK